MRKITLITGNKRKIWQAKEVLEPLGISVEAKELEVIEIQSHDANEIAIAKARSAYELEKRPLIICDHFWSFSSLRGFPGGYMKDMNYWFEAADFLALMHDKSDRKVTLSEVVVYIDNHQIEIFTADFAGEVILEARGQGEVTCERITVFEGQSETIAEKIDNGEHARDMSGSAWRKFGEWFMSQKA